MDVNEELKFLGKFKQKIWGGGQGGWVRGVGSGGCGVLCVGSGGVRWGGRVWGVKVDVNDELKFLGKFIRRGGGSGGGQVGGGG